MGIVSHSYRCSNCQKIVLLVVEIESPSDYYILDDSCPECGHPTPDIDVSESIRDFYAFRNDIEEKDR